MKDVTKPKVVIPQSQDKAINPETQNKEVTLGLRYQLGGTSHLYNLCAKSAKTIWKKKKITIFRKVGWEIQCLKIKNKTKKTPNHLLLLFKIEGILHADRHTCIFCSNLLVCAVDSAEMTELRTL